MGSVANGYCKQRRHFLINLAIVDYIFFFFSSRRRHTRCGRDWSSDVCSSDLSVVLPRKSVRWTVWPAGPTMGEPAPDFSLPDLAGQMVHLSDFRGSTTLVLFWRPSCGFCQRMLEDLKAWEAQKPAGAPRLLVVSTDSVESNQAMGLRSPVVLDQDGMGVGRLFGATGTPMAVLVDAEGKIVSELAAGAPAVLALAGQEKDTTAPA